MSHERRLRFKTLFMVLLMVVCANVGDLLLKRGMLQIGAVQVSLTGLWHALLSTTHNGTIWLGIIFLTTLAVVILHEMVTPKRWVGVVLICIGVLLVGQTKPSTTNVPPVAS